MNIHEARVIREDNRQGETAANRQVFYRCKRDGSCWQLGKLDNRYCWWSHSTGQVTKYKYVDSREDLDNLAYWFQEHGYEVIEL